MEILQAIKERHSVRAYLDQAKRRACDRCFRLWTEYKG